MRELEEDDFDSKMREFGYLDGRSYASGSRLGDCRVAASDDLPGIYNIHFRRGVRSMIDHYCDESPDMITHAQE